MPLKLFLSDPDDPVGQILYLTSINEGYEMISRADIESNVIIHNREAPELNLNRRNDEVFNRINFEGTKRLCAAIDKWTVKPSAFIYLSSVSVYGSKGEELITENHPLNGSTAYAKSKILAEDFLIEWAYKTKVTLCILRLPKIIAGEKSSGILAEMIETIRAGNYVGITRKKNRKSALWAADIVTLIPKIPAIEGVFNLTDGYHPSFKELEELIASSLNKRLFLKVPYIFAKPIAWVGTVLGNRLSLNMEKLHEITTPLTFDDQKARMTFDWKPSKVLDKLKEVL